ncbi:D-arabinono-1,4-lactone oxidase [Parafrigoribacterium soli]|uniref:D-arabinono-1,4-lactone oxidase n=1 Tax=Parafrigoribacterium soli TaxID=3144663 RepID=UPI00387EAD55
MIAPGRTWRNWGRSESIRPQFVARPSSVDEVVAAVRFARERGLPVKAIGAGHSFTGIAVAPGLQLDLSGLDGLLSVDAVSGRVMLGAGTHLYQLPALLGPHGLALENMGDIDRQTISGATSTGTHGTGSRFRGLAAQIVAVTLVTADGSLLRVSETENAELLPAARLGLGALGILVDLTIQCVPAFLLSAVERPEPLDSVLDDFEARADAVDHFEFYWFPHTRTALTKNNSRLDGSDERHPLPKAKEWLEERVLSNATFSLMCHVGRVAPALTPGVNRLAGRLIGNRDFTDHSSEVFVTSRTTRFREMEYAIPRAAIPEALRAVDRLIAERGWRISFPIEVRVAAPDDIWLSTAQGRESGYIAVHRFFRDDFREYFAGVEAIMRGLGGRPHWGKIHRQDAASLAESYPHFSDFLAVRDRLDPDRVFANPYLDRVLGR